MLHIRNFSLLLTAACTAYTQYLRHWKSQLNTSHTAIHETASAPTQQADRPALTASTGVAISHSPPSPHQACKVSHQQKQQANQNSQTLTAGTGVAADSEPPHRQIIVWVPHWQPHHPFRMPPNGIFICRRVEAAGYAGF
jgi:hypothetical protein